MLHILLSPLCGLGSQDFLKAVLSLLRPQPAAPCRPGTGCSTVRPQEKIFPLKPQVFLPGSALSAQHPPPPAGDPAVPLAHRSPRWRPPVPASAPPEESLQTPTYLPPSPLNNPYGFAMKTCCGEAFPKSGSGVSVWEDGDDALETVVMGADMNGHHGRSVLSSQ